jgi:uncharacterized protein YjbJ (UPF0337 family)
MSAGTDIAKGRMKELLGSILRSTKLREAGKAEKEKGQVQRATAQAARELKKALRKADEDVAGEARAIFHPRPDPTSVLND